MCLAPVHMLPKHDTAKYLKIYYHVNILMMILTMMYLKYCPNISTNKMMAFYMSGSSLGPFFSYQQQNNISTFACLWHQKCSIVSYCLMCFHHPVHRYTKGYPWKKSWHHFKTRILGNVDGFWLLFESCNKRM